MIWLYDSECALQAAKAHLIEIGIQTVIVIRTTSKLIVHEETRCC
jgi:hypothetical protein